MIQRIELVNLRYKNIDVLCHIFAMYAISWLKELWYLPFDAFGVVVMMSCFLDDQDDSSFTRLSLPSLSGTECQTIFLDISITEHSFAMRIA